MTQPEFDQMTKQVTKEYKCLLSRIIDAYATYRGELNLDLGVCEFNECVSDLEGVRDSVEDLFHKMIGVCKTADE
jgi:hypothetical protein